MSSLSRKTRNYIALAFGLALIAYGINFLIFVVQYIQVKRISPLNGLLYDLSGPYFTAPSLAEKPDSFAVYVIKGKERIPVYALGRTAPLRAQDGNTYCEILKSRSGRHLHRHLKRQSLQHKLETPEQVRAFRQLIDIYHPGLTYDSIKINYALYQNNQKVPHEYCVAAPQD